LAEGVAEVLKQDLHSVAAAFGARMDSIMPCERAARIFLLLTEGSGDILAR
jgi:hypothetical protein